MSFLWSGSLRGGKGALLLAAVVLALVGCASKAPQPPEQLVAERAEARWKNLMKQDFAAAYGYLAPSYRALVSQAEYRKRFGSAGVWTNVIVHQVNCEPEACKVRVRVTTQVRVPSFAMRIPEVNAYIDERWVREDGQWWLYQGL